MLSETYRLAKFPGLVLAVPVPDSEDPELPPPWLAFPPLDAMACTSSVGL